MHKPELICIAHRGAMGHAPENTLLAVSKALDLGAVCIEIDVYFVDKQLIVFHDDDLERTTNGKGLVEQQTFEYLRSLDAGEGEQIPTLDEVCQLINSKACLNIELKGAGTAAPVAKLIAQYLANGWSIDSFLVSSFNKQELLSIHQLNPQLKLGVLIDGCDDIKTDYEFALQLEAFSVNPSLRCVTQEFVEAAHASCMQVYVYTVDELDDVIKMQELGVDGVFTGFPERVLDNYRQGDVAKRWCE